MIDVVWGAIASQLQTGEMEVDRRHGRRDILGVARRIANCVVAPGFAVEPDTTVLLLNSLITAHASSHRIYLNAFQRSGEVLNYFGHRLRRLGFDVHSWNPSAILPSPQARDVLICLSGSLRTEPVLVSLLHAELGGLYKFVITAQSAEESRKKFQGVLPVHIPGVTADGRAAEDDLRTIMPLGSLFEVRAFLYLEAVVEALGEVLAGAESMPTTEVVAGEINPILMTCLARVRAEAPRVPEVMRELVQQFVDGLDEIDPGELDGLLDQLLTTAHAGRATYVTGYGRNNEICGMFAHRLANLSMTVSLTPARLERPTAADDFLVAITGSGTTYEVLQRLSGARQAGLRTAVLTSAADSAAIQFVDQPVRIPAQIESEPVGQFADRQIHPSPARRPRQSTFCLNSLLVLEAVFAVLMAELGKTEADLAHTDPWQGFDCIHT